MDTRADSPNSKDPTPMHLYHPISILVFLPWAFSSWLAILIYQPTFHKEDERRNMEGHAMA